MLGGNGLRCPLFVLLQRKVSVGRMRLLSGSAPAVRFSARSRSSSSTMSADLPGSVAHLCAELRGLLEAEVAAGNRIAGTGRGLHGKAGVVVLLSDPFRVKPATLPTGVEFRVVNDPLWWQAEYVHHPTQHCLACGH